VHGVTIEGDSVRAVPFFRPPNCDSCAIRVALRDVDSVQVEVANPRANLIGGLLMISLALLLYALTQIPST
jgi:hypothetical protein